MVSIVSFAAPTRRRQARGETMDEHANQHADAQSNSDSHASAQNNNAHIDSSVKTDKTQSADSHTKSSVKESGVKKPNAKIRAGQQDSMALSFTIIGWACYVVAALLLSWVVGALVHNDMLARSVAHNVSTAPATWPEANRRSVYDRAKEYNAKLDDQFSGSIPADAKNEEGAARETLDSYYMKTLDVNGKGAMASLKIPQISVDIPIYHTTLDSSLDSGAGHIYGTAMPIGEEHTYTALAAHSGGVQGMLFTRLDELKKGAVFYIDVLGGEHGYRVQDIRTVKPEQLEKTLQELRAQYKDSSATVTLITCTPVGVNTDRLLVTGVREPIPDKIAPASTQKDSKLLAIGIGVGLFILLLIAAIVFVYLRKRAKDKKLSK